MDDILLAVGGTVLALVLAKWFQEFLDWAENRLMGKGKNRRL